VVHAVRGVLGADADLLQNPRTGSEPPAMRSVERSSTSRDANPVVQPSPRGTAGKWHVDLKATNRLLLERADVDPEAIESGPECTHCDRARFFSYRRDGSATGQLMGVIARKL